jgi:hypothetical protein
MVCGDVHQTTSCAEWDAGDGRASQRIVAVILGEPVEEFARVELTARCHQPSMQPVVAWYTRPGVPAQGSDGSVRPGASSWYWHLEAPWHPGAQSVQTTRGPDIGAGEPEGGASTCE